MQNHLQCCIAANYSLASFGQCKWKHFVIRFGFGILTMKACDGDVWGMQAHGKIKALTQQVADLEADLRKASSDKADMLRLAQKSTMMQVHSASRLSA